MNTVMQNKAEVQNNSTIKLHLGCGTNKLSGWVNIDSVKDCQPDLVHDIMRPLPYADQTVDEILAEDLLEHFDKYMRYIVFGDWARVLKIGGTITIRVPNFKKLLFRYFKFGFDNLVDMAFGENMWRSEIYLGHFGNHKWGYSPESLSAFVKNFGITSSKVTLEGLNIKLVGSKDRHATTDELNKLMIYAHANKTGQGKPFLSLGFVREKINKFQNSI
ncbi:MAG: methyltransferase domain-containing protein [Candidatus Omnitrophota bacterium]